VRRNMKIRQMLSTQKETLRKALRAGTPIHR